MCCLVMHVQGTFQAAGQLSQSLQPNAQQPAEYPHAWRDEMLTAPQASKAGCLSQAEQAQSVKAKQPTRMCSIMQHLLIMP